MKKDNWFIRTFQNPWFAAMVISAFAAVISAFQIDSAWADAHNTNWLWWTSTILCGIAAVFFLIKANNTSTGTGG